MNVKRVPKYHMRLFERDVYFLATMLMARNKLAREGVLSEAQEEHFEDQVNRLLMLVAVAARQLLEDLGMREKGLGIEVCGNYRNEDERDEPELTFYRACNKVIHAREVEIAWRDPVTMKEYIRIEDIQPRRGAYGVETTTNLHGARFLKCCTMLSEKFMQ